MKKIHLLCIAVVALMATACQKNVPPTLSLTYNTGSSLTEIEVGTDITFQFDCQGTKLETLSVTITCDDNVVYSDNISLAEVDQVTKTLSYSTTQVGHYVINAMLKDKKSNTTTAYASFDVIAKSVSFFEGDYEGHTTIDGTVVSTGIPYSYQIPNDEIPISATVTATEHDNVVAISLTYDGLTYATTGIIEGIHIDLEPFDVELDINGNTINGTIDLEGDKNDETLTLAGTIEGTGTVTIEGFPVQLPVTLSGTVSGEMSRQR